ncbi:HAD family hydrolase [Synechococcus elongatus]|uniref:HAD family hydrolase n=1 Tax=Synechococcus elongatus TaxID=32046 RepID=UPI001EDD5DF5|nr:HAD family hydrolase [Synechococcus elongatus]
MPLLELRSLLDAVVLAMPVLQFRDQRSGDRWQISVQALLFDKDGTLANSEAFLQRLVLARYGAIAAQVPDLTTDLLLSWGYQQERVDPAGLMAIGSRQENLIAAASAIAAQGYSWPRALDLAEKSFRRGDAACEPKAAQTPPIAGIQKLLSQARSLGLKIAVISADSEAQIQSFLDCHQLRDFVDLIWGCDRRPSKPDPAAVLTVCQQLNVDPSTAVVIGDADSDLRMAAGAGVAAIAAAWGWSQAPIFEAIAPIVTDVEDLKLLRDASSGDRPPRI